MRIRMLDILMQPFMQRAIVIGLIVAIVCGYLGVFVTLKRMSFFVDAIAHSSLAGIALGIFFSIDPILSALIFAIIVAFGMAYVKKQGNLSFDTIIGIFFPTSFAIGIIVIGLVTGYRPDLISYLFGNILAVTNQDLAIAAIIGPLVMILFIALYRRMVFSIIDPDMARVVGLRLFLLEVLFLVSLAAVVVVSIKVLGIILVGALIVIPAAAAKNVSRSFSEEIAFSILFGIISVITGLFLSLVLNVASGATVVLVAVTLFIITFIFKKLQRA